MTVTITNCTCGQPVEIRTGADSKDNWRKDGKQAVYLGEDGYNIFRCRSCMEPLDKTVPEFAFEDPSAEGDL